MKTNVYLGLAIRIIVLFGIGMLGTYLPDILRDFFGDTPCTDRCHDLICDEWVWGSRHYWYFWMMFLLFILSAVNAVIQAINLVKANYDTSSWG